MKIKELWNKIRKGVKAGMAAATESNVLTDNRVVSMIEKFKASGKYELMQEGERYYQADNDIKNRKITRKVDGHKEEETWRANNKLAHAKYKIQVDEKIAYLLTKPVTYKTDGTDKNDTYVEKVKDVLGKHFQYQLTQLGYYEVPKKKEDKKEKLPSVNQMVKNIKGALHDAGVDSKYIAAEIVRIYSDNGYPVKVPVLSDVPKLWDCTTMAKELGIFSESGRPHDKAMSAIIQKLDVFTEEIVKTAYSRNGHDGVTVQYKDSVLQKAKEWLEENGYPTMIEYRLSNGNINKCKVVYQEVA